MGAEFCPYCATERWSVVMALSKFGTFSHLVGTTSSSTDVDPRPCRSPSTGRAIPVRRLCSLATRCSTTTGGASLATPYSSSPPPRNTRCLPNTTRPLTPPGADSGTFPFIYLAGRFVLIGAQWLDAQLLGFSGPRRPPCSLRAKKRHFERGGGGRGFPRRRHRAVTHAEPTSVCSRVPCTLLGVSTSTPGPDAAVGPRPNSRVLDHPTVTQCRGS